MGRSVGRTHGGGAYIFTILAIQLLPFDVADGLIALGPKPAWDIAA